MNSKSLFTILLSVWLLVGCGSASDEEENVREDTVFDPMLETMDRAEQTGETIENRVDQLNQQLEEQEDDEEE